MQRTVFDFLTATRNIRYPGRNGLAGRISNSSFEYAADLIDIIFFAFPNGRPVDGLVDKWVRNVRQCEAM